MKKWARFYIVPALLTVCLTAISLVVFWNLNVALVATYALVVATCIVYPVLPDSWKKLRFRDSSTPLMGWARNSGWERSEGWIDLPGELRRRTLERLRGRVDGIEIVVESPAIFSHQLYENRIGVCARTWLSVPGFSHILVLPHRVNIHPHEQLRAMEEGDRLLELESEAFRRAYTIETDSGDDSALARLVFTPTVIVQFERAVERGEALTFEYRQGIARLFLEASPSPKAVEALLGEAVPLFSHLRNVAQRRVAESQS
jgi:hypothetical protein